MLTQSEIKTLIRSREELFLLCQRERLTPAEFVGGELRLQGVNLNGKFTEDYGKTH